MIQAEDYLEDIKFCITKLEIQTAFNTNELLKPYLSKLREIEETLSDMTEELHGINQNQNEEILGS